MNATALAGWTRWMRPVVLFLICGSALLTPIDYGIPHTTSWIANSLPGGTSPRGWVQIDVTDIYVRPDGTVYTNSIWDETGREGGIYKDGKVAGRLQNLHFRGGWAIAANATHLFVAMIDFKSSKGRHKLRKYRFDGTPVADAVVNDETDPLKPVLGIAANAKEVFVADGSANRIAVYDANNLAPIRQLEFDAPGKMTLDGAGGLWVIRGSTNNIVRISPCTGAQQGEIAGLGHPSALAIDNRGHLMVGDSGPNQQVIFYDLQGRRLSSFGVPGGILSGTPGQIGPRKLISPVGVGTDSSGNIYVASRLGGDINVAR